MDSSNTIPTRSRSASTTRLLKPKPRGSWNAFKKDASVWTGDASVAKMIQNSLGWLTVAGEMLGVVDELRAFADEVRGKFRHVMVCGMGGSSLCPEVLAQTFGQQPGYPSCWCSIRQTRT